MAGIPSTINRQVVAAVDCLHAADAPDAVACPVADGAHGAGELRLEPQPVDQSRMRILQSLLHKGSHEYVARHVHIFADI